MVLMVVVVPPGKRVGSGVFYYLVLGMMSRSRDILHRQRSRLVLLLLEVTSGDYDGLRHALALGVAVIVVVVVIVPLVVVSQRLV